jgi:hypothetical protein
MKKKIKKRASNIHDWATGQNEVIKPTKINFSKGTTRKIGGRYVLPKNPNKKKKVKRK